VKLLRQLAEHIAVRNARGLVATTFCVKCARDMRIGKGRRGCPMTDLLDMIAEIEQPEAA